MQLYVDQKDLSAALSKLAHALENNDELEAYTHVSFRCHGSHMSLGASNRHGHAEARLKLQCILREGVQFGLPGNLLKKVVSRMPAGMIEFRVKDTDVKISSEASLFSLPLLSDDMFIKSPDYSSIRYTAIDMGEFLKALRKVAHCIPADNHKPQMVSICVNDRHFVACDGFRMAVYPNEVFASGMQILIHADQVPRLSKVYNGAEGEGGLAIEDDSKIHLAGASFFCTSRLKSGDYVQYASVIPQQAGCVVKFSKERALAALQRAVLVYGPKDSPLVNVTIRDGEMLLTSKSQWGKSRETVECRAAGDQEFGANGRFLAEALAQLEEEFAELHVYSREGEAYSLVLVEGGYLNVLMPVKRSREESDVSAYQGPKGS